MSSIIGRAAFSAARPAQLRAIRPRFSSTTAAGGAGNEVDQKAGKDALKQGAKRDPELYILFAIMSGVFGLAGWHFCKLLLKLFELLWGVDWTNANSNSPLANLRFLGTVRLQSPTLRVLEDWIKCCLPIPPRWRPQQGKEGRSFSSQHSHCPQCQLAKGSFQGNGGSSTRHTNIGAGLTRPIQQIWQARLLDSRISNLKDSPSRVKWPRLQLYSDIELNSNPFPFLFPT